MTTDSLLLVVQVATDHLAGADLHALTDRVANSVAGGLAGAVCPQAPPGVDTYVNMFTSWVKFLVLAFMGICLFGAIGLLVWGRVAHHARGARLGFDGLAVVLVAGVLYVVGQPILGQITGEGC